MSRRCHVFARITRRLELRVVAATLAVILAGLVASLVPADARAGIALNIASVPGSASAIVFNAAGAESEGDTFSAQCSACVTVAGFPGTYDLYVGAFGMVPVSQLPGAPSAAQYYGETLEGDCHITLSNAGGNFGGGCSMTVIARPDNANPGNTDYAIFQFNMDLSSASGTLSGATGAAYVIIGGSTPAVGTTTSYACTYSPAPPPPWPTGCNPGLPANTSFATFNNVTLDWSGGIATTPYTPPAAGQVPVPDVAGLTATAASAQLSAAGLSASFVSEASATVPVGAFISQSPAAFSSVASGTPVIVAVSSGAPAITDAIPNYSFYNAVNPVTKKLYVAVSRGSDIVAYSTVDDTVVANIPVPGTSVAGLVADSVNDVIYAVNQNGTVTVIDGATDTVNATLTVGRAPIGIAVDPGLNTAYVANSSETFISVLHGPTRNGAGAITAPATGVTQIGGILPLGGIAVDATHHVVYAIIDGPAPLGELNYTLAIINGSTNTLTGTVSYLDYASSTDIAADSLAVDQSSGIVVIADAEDRAVHVYNPQSAALSSYGESFYPTHVAVDSTNHVAYVSTGYGNVEQINLTGGGQSVVYTPDASAASCEAGGTALAVDPGAAEALFTSCDGTNGAVLQIWSGATQALNASLYLGNPVGSYGSVSGDFAVVVNPSTHVAYVANSTPAVPVINVIDGPTPGAGPTLTLSVNGAAAVPLDSDPTVPFGSVALGHTSAPQLLTVTNTGTAPATVPSPTITGSGFTTTGGSCEAFVPLPGSGGSCETTLVFQPTNNVAATGSVIFYDNQRDTPHLIQLTGTGTGTHPLTITPATMPLGYVGLLYPPGTYVQFGATNASGIANLNVCATLPSGQPDTASCCSGGDGGGPASCPAGLLPPGIIFYEPELNGTPTQAGSYQFSVTASDSAGDTGYQDYTLVIDPAYSASVVLASPTVVGGSSVNATVTLNQGAPAGGAFVFLDSSNPSIVPSSVASVTAGATSATAALAASTVTTATTVTITPYYNGNGASVTLTVEPSGPGSVAVANVVGFTQAAATTAIEAVGLSVTTSSATSLTVAYGDVISESPSAGNEVTVGSVVNLVISSGKPSEAVPNVVGDTQGAAIAAIQAVDLTVATTTATSLTVQAGYVISQSPSPPASLSAGSVVSLVISSGLPTEVVPNVVNLTEAAASTALTNAHLTLGTITSAASLTVPAGDVISESPTASSPATAGSAVNLVISSGLPTEVVPELENLTQSAAGAALTAVHLKLGTVSSASNPTVPAGEVISQSPVATTPVAADTAVNLVISSGPASAVVPNVVGLTQAAAASAITGADLVLGTVTTQASPTVTSGDVISETPAANSGVSAGSPVNLVISSGPAAPPAITLTLAGAPAIVRGATLLTVTFQLQNTGNVTATSVAETTASLNGVAAVAAAAPLTDLAAGASAQVVLSFPASAGTSGAKVKLSVDGGYVGSSVSGSWGFSARTELP